MALNLQNAKEKFINALFGVPAQTEGVTPNVSYGEKVDEYLNGLGSQPYMQGLLNQPKETGLTLDQYKQGVANGLNYGVPEIAQAQKELGINIPKTGEEIDLANVGQFNQPTGLSVGTATTPRQGGFFNDLAKGYQENATQGFNVQNLAPDQNKGLATRIGEGLGTLTRFANSPLGRGLIAYGATRALGYDDPVEQGLIAGVTRQGNVTRDKAYRQGLINMGVKEAQVNAIPGIVSDDIFSNIARARQLQDYAQYRQDMLKAQKEQNKIMQENKMAELSQKVAQNKLENYYKGQQIAQGWEKIKNDKEGVGKPNFNQITTMRKEFSSIPAIKNANEIKRQFDNVTNTYNAYKQGKLRANAADQAMVTTLNKILDPTSVVRESEFARTAAGQSIFARMQGYFDKISKGGGGLTNAEREDLYNAMQEMYNANQAEAREYINAYTDLANRYSINPADIMPRQYSSSETSTNNKTNQNSGQMVKMKSPDGKIYNVPIEKVETMKAKGGVVING
jgi:hypothetical protein